MRANISALLLSSVSRLWSSQVTTKPPFGSAALVLPTDHDVRPEVQVSAGQHVDGDEGHLEVRDAVCIDVNLRGGSTRVHDFDSGISGCFVESAQRQLKVIEQGIEIDGIVAAAAGIEVVDNVPGIQHAGVEDRVLAAGVVGVWCAARIVGAHVDDIGAWTAADEVVAFAADQDVVALNAIQRVDTVADNFWRTGKGRRGGPCRSAAKRRRVRPERKRQGVWAGCKGPRSGSSGGGPQEAPQKK